MIQERNSTVLCEENQFLCLNGESCVNVDWMCDGDADCTDHSDENQDHCKEYLGKFCYPILRKVSYFSAKFLQQFEMQEVGECQQQMIYICISQHLYLAN